MLFDLKLKDGSTWMWGTNSSSIYRPDGTKLFAKQYASRFPLETSKEEYHFSDMPRYVGILLGEKCNKDCEYCYQTKLRKKGLNWNTGPDDVQPFVNLMQNTFREVGKISFWGGEPLVYWKTLKPLAEKLRKIYPLSPFSFVTNGFLLNEEIVNWAIKNRITVCVSWDGPGKLRGEDVYEANGKNIRYAAEQLGGYFVIKPTAGKGCTNFRETRKYFRDRQLNSKIDSKSVIRLIPEHEEATTLSPEELKDLEEAARWDAIHGQRVEEIRGLLAAIMSRGSPWTSPGECAAGLGGNISVNLKGDIFPCHEDFGGEPLGNLNDLENAKCAGFFSPYERKVCRECPVAIACHGMCPKLPLDAKPICVARKARSMGYLRAALEMLIGVEVLEIVPHGV